MKPPLGRLIEAELSYHARLGEFRVVRQAYENGAVVATYDEGSRPKKGWAIGLARAALVPGSRVAVFDNTARCVFSVEEGVTETNPRIDWNRPISITALAGLASPRSRAGAYRRRR